MEAASFCCHAEPVEAATKDIAYSRKKLLKNYQFSIIN
jgi:hypothetical protein